MNTLEATVAHWNTHYVGGVIETTYQGKADPTPITFKGKVVSVKVPKSCPDMLVTLETADGFKSFYPSKAVNWDYVPE